MTKRKVFRSEATQATLMQAAEKLFAGQGVANVSVRDILNEAGQKNQSAVQYHFGNKSELLEQLLILHAKSLDERRSRMLVELPAQPELIPFLEAFLHPLVDEVASGESGRYFAAYLAQAYAEPGFDPISRVQKKHSASLLQCLQHLESFMGRNYKNSWLYDIVAFGLYRWAAQSDANSNPEELKRSLVAIAAAVVSTARKIDTPQRKGE